MSRVVECRFGAGDQCSEWEPGVRNTRSPHQTRAPKKAAKQAIVTASPLAAVLLIATGSIHLQSLAGAAPDNSTWKAPARAARKQNPIPSDPGSITKGKQLYTTACFPCHGAAGKGDGPSAPTLERNGAPIRPGNLSDPKRWEETDGELFWKITEGNSPMPSWGPTLTEEQRWSIVNYIRTLAPKPKAGTNGPGGTP